MTELFQSNAYLLAALTVALCMMLSQVVIGWMLVRITERLIRIERRLASPEQDHPPKVIATRASSQASSPSGNHEPQ